DANGDLFGTTQGGGSANDGTVFELVKNGSSYTLTTLVNFNGSNGAVPAGGLVADANGDLFGTTVEGGSGSQGTVFEITNSGFVVKLPAPIMTSLTDGAASVTPGDLLNLQAGITAQQNTAEATTEAALIQAGKDTVAAYAARLEAGVMATSEVVMATVSLMQSSPGGVPTAGKLLTPTSPANEFQHLTVTYLPAQQAFAVANNLNITIYNAEAVALGIGAGGDGTQNNFLKNFGSAALTVSQFETAVFNLTNVSVTA